MSQEVSSLAHTPVLLKETIEALKVQAAQAAQVNQAAAVRAQALLPITL